MSKKKIIIGGIAVLAVAAIGAHVVAPSFFEGRFRAYLTNPNADLAGSFDSFELSLLGRTMAATDISLRTPQGVEISADSMAMEGVNWLTLLNSNPFGDVLASDVLISNAMVKQDGRMASSSTPSLGNLRITLTDGDINYAIDSGELPDLVLKDGTELLLTADMLALGNADHKNIREITARGLSYSRPQTGEGISMETMAANDCVLASNVPFSLALPDAPLEHCAAISGSTVMITLDDVTKVTAAGFAVDQLSPNGVETANITDVEVFDNDTRQLSISAIDIAGLNQSIRPDAFDDDQKLDAREWQHLIDNLSIDHFSISNAAVQAKEGTGKLGGFAIDGLKNGELAKLNVSGIDIEIKEDAKNPSLKLGTFEVSKFSLNRLHRVLDKMETDVAQSADPDVQIKALQNQTIGDLGLVMSPLIYETFLFSDFSVSMDGDPENRFTIGLDRANGSLGDPVKLDGSNMTFAKKARAAYEGFYIELGEGAPVKPMVAEMLGLETFDRITMNGKNNVTWDETSGVYTYDIEDLSIDEIGGISLSARVGNLTHDVMTELLSARLDQSEKLQQIGMAQIGLDGARLEIKGEKLVKLFLRLAAQGNGQTAEDLQLVGAMTLMQMQQNFAQFPQLSSAISELVDWFSNPQHLVIELSPDAPVPFGVIAAGGLQPHTAADLMGLRIQANENIK
ncbi:hypothetical protein [Thalassospira australica]|uniref:hypothetical protein n=1 Tax=Thalassospira australica TaxID=1528106 RepID=UPI00051A7DDA|nr:hypothetical protein [Thalassospira australica]